MLYDADTTGVMYSKKLASAHPWIKRIPWEEFATVKDVSNAVEHGEKETLDKLRDYLRWM